MGCPPPSPDHNYRTSLHTQQKNAPKRAYEARFPIGVAQITRRCDRNAAVSYCYLYSFRGGSICLRFSRAQRPREHAAGVTRLTSAESWNRPQTQAGAPSSCEADEVADVLDAVRDAVKVWPTGRWLRPAHDSVGPGLALAETEGFEPSIGLYKPITV